MESNANANETGMQLPTFPLVPGELGRLIEVSGEVSPSSTEEFGEYFAMSFTKSDASGDGPSGLDYCHSYSWGRDSFRFHIRGGGNAHVRAVTRLPVNTANPNLKCAVCYSSPSLIPVLTRWWNKFSYSYSYTFKFFMQFISHFLWMWRHYWWGIEADVRTLFIYNVVLSTPTRISQKVKKKVDDDNNSIVLIAQCNTVHVLLYITWP